MAFEDRRRAWAALARRLVALVILLVLIDQNATHVQRFVQGLVASWRASQTQNELGAIAGALDAEHAANHRYPDPSTLPDFIRQWMPATRGGDPALDRWGCEYRLEIQGVAYVLRSAARTPSARTRTMSCGTGARSYRPRRHRPNRSRGNNRRRRPAVDEELVFSRVKDMAKVTSKLQLTLPKALADHHAILAAPTSCRGWMRTSGVRGAHGLREPHSPAPRL